MKISLIVLAVLFIVNKFIDIRNDRYSKKLLFGKMKLALILRLANDSLRNNIQKMKDDRHCKPINYGDVCDHSYLNGIYEPTDDLNKKMVDQIESEDDESIGTPFDKEKLFEEKDDYCYEAIDDNDLDELISTARNYLPLPSETDKTTAKVIVGEIVYGVRPKKYEIVFDKEYLSDICIGWELAEVSQIIN